MNLGFCSSALGGIRTPNLLIRSLSAVVSGRLDRSDSRLAAAIRQLIGVATCGPVAVKTAVRALQSAHRSAVAPTLMVINTGTPKIDRDPASPAPVPHSERRLDRGRSHSHLRRTPASPPGRHPDTQRGHLGQPTSHPATSQGPRMGQGDPLALADPAVPADLQDPGRRSHLEAGRRRRTLPLRHLRSRRGQKAARMRSSASNSPLDATTRRCHKKRLHRKLVWASFAVVHKCSLTLAARTFRELTPGQQSKEMVGSIQRGDAAAAAGASLGISGRY